MRTTTPDLNVKRMLVFPTCSTETKASRAFVTLNRGSFLVTVFGVFGAFAAFGWRGVAAFFDRVRLVVVTTDSDFSCAAVSGASGDGAGSVSNEVA